MSELEQTLVIEKMNQLTEEDRRFLLGVLAGLTARKEGKDNAEQGEGAEGNSVLPE